ncbi:MAG: AAA family ATPase [Rhodospirillaceae bacterium]|nr:AAA family ATPase [Rhodospirillaceae bacterium]
MNTAEQAQLGFAEPVEAVKAEIAREGLSQEAAAGQIGISGAALSQWLRGVYKGDAEAVADKAKGWLAGRSDRRALKAGTREAPPWADTPLARRALAALAHAHLASDLAVVYGAAGLGKSVAMRRYAGMRPNIWTVTATEAASSVAACLGRVAAAMGLRLDSRQRTAAATEAAIVERMSGSGGLLAVDEAQHLPTRSLEELRGLHDASGCGVALIGSDPFWLQLSGGRRPEFAQLFSRVGKRVRLGRPGAADVTALLAAWGLEARGLESVAQAVAARHGALRGLTKALVRAHAIAGGKAVTEAHLRAAWKELSGEALS